jgi:WD40 repeat protein
MKQLREFEDQPGAILALAFDGGKRFAVAGSAGEIRVYDADSGGRLQTIPAGTEWIYALAFNPAANLLAAAGFDGRVRLFDVKDGKQLEAFAPVPLGRVRQF